MLQSHNVVTQFSEGFELKAISEDIDHSTSYLALDMQRNSLQAQRADHFLLLSFRLGHTAQHHHAQCLIRFPNSSIIRKPNHFRIISVDSTFPT